MPKFSSVGGYLRDAVEVSKLLNANNKLTSTHSAITVLDSTVQYILLYDSAPNNNVIGCIGIDVQLPIALQDGVTVLKHLSVNEKYRRKGYGKKLLIAAIDRVSTKIIRAFIRSDNTQSLSLFESVGFMAKGWKQMTNYKLILVEKEKDVRCNRIA